MSNYCKFIDPNLTQGEDNIIFRARIIWRDIATWIRAYLVYVHFESDPKLQEMTINKLMSLPIQFGNMIRLFFGDAVADEYTDILTNYIALLIHVIYALKIGDVNAIEELTDQLMQNTNQRADFLSKINPFWQKNELEGLMNTFTNMTIHEAETFFSGDYENNLRIFDRLLAHTTITGDYAAQGIMNYLKYSAQLPKNRYY